MTPSIVRTPTKCRLCGHEFAYNVMADAAVVGSNPNAKLAQVEALTKPLTKHLQKHHPEVIHQAQLTGMEFSGYMMIAKVFEMDQATEEKIGLDFTRWNIHRHTTRLGSIPSDERIRERVKKLFPDDPHTSSMDAVVKLLCEMRDAITEKDRYNMQAGPIVDQNGNPV